jgi:hypothetical protein
MLYRDGQPFTTSLAHYLDAAPEEGGTARIVLRVLPEGCPEPVLAVLDPAAPWGILNWEIACILGVSLRGEALRLRTWRGTVEGELHRLIITLLAEEGEPVSVEATVFVSEEWTGPGHPNFLGYSGFLERIRWAVDPAANMFYFGPVE